MNYDYTIKLLNPSQYQKIYFQTANNNFSYTMNNLILTRYVHINLNNYSVTLQNNNLMYQPGVTIHRAHDFLEIKFHGKMYGEINTVNAILTTKINEESICVYSNRTRLFDIYWTKNNNNPEVITTQFETLNNKFTKMKQ